MSSGTILAPTPQAFWALEVSTATQKPQVKRSCCMTSRISCDRGVEASSALMWPKLSTPESLAVVHCSRVQLCSVTCLSMWPVNNIGV